MGQKLNVFQFHDYRDLLVALIAERKREGKVFSYRWFSQKAGLTAPNFLNLVVNRKRHLSPETVESVIRIFQLGRSEAEFFQHLVSFNKAKTLSEKEHFAHQLLKLKKIQTQYPLSLDQFEYYSDWYHIPIREILNLNSPPQSDEQISQVLLPYVSPGDVKTSLEKLKELQMIKKVGPTWRVAEENVTTGHKFSSYGVVKFHKKMMALASESLDRFAVEEREISSVTFGLSEANFSRIKKMIEEFRSQLMSIAEEDREKERVYQVNFQLFPLSKKKERAK